MSHDRDEDVLSELEQAERLGHIRAELENDLMAKVLSTVEGRFLAQRIVAFCGVDQPSFASQDRDAHYLEGRRGVGIELRNWVRGISPLYLERMEAEAGDRETFCRARAEA